MTRITKAIAAGNYATTAAKFAGVSESTYFEWLRRGALGEEPYAEFLDAIEQAEAAAEVHHVTLIARAASEGTWQASAWFLERKHPDQWGKRDRLDVNASATTQFLMRWPDAPDDSHDLPTGPAPAAALGHGGPEAVPRPGVWEEVGQDPTRSSDCPDPSVRR